MTGPFFAVRMKKKAVGGLAGTMAGDALTHEIFSELDEMKPEVPIFLT
jgi:hypothetical protein